MHKTENVSENIWISVSNINWFYHSDENLLSIALCIWLLIRMGNIPYTYSIANGLRLIHLFLKYNYSVYLSITHSDGKLHWLSFQFT